MQKSAPAFIALLCFLTAICAVLPRFTVAAPGLAGLLSIVLWRFDTGRFPALRKDIFIIVAAITALSALSSLWAINPHDAFDRTARTALTLLPAALFMAQAGNIAEENRRLFRAWLPFAVIFAGLFCAFDLVSGGGIYNLMHTNKTPDETEFNLSLLNRNVVVFALLLPPALYAVHTGTQTPQNKLLLYSALLLPALIVLYLTHSQSVQVALALTALAVFLFPIRRNAAWLALGAILLSGVALAPWIVQLLYHHMAQYVMGYEGWMAHTYAAHRLEIWDFVARKALESPLHGFGVEATRQIAHFDTQKLYTPHDHVLHPHSGTMQVWIEMGALGITFLLALIAYILKTIRNIPTDTDKRLALGIFIALFFMANTTYGLWQGWWLGLICLTTAAVILLCRNREENLNLCQYDI